MEAISPVIRGLMNGFSLGNMFQQHQMDKQKEARFADQQKFDQESKSANLLAQLAELGAHQVTPSDQYEIDGGTHVNFTDRLPIEGGPEITASQTTLPGRVLTTPGTHQQFVLPSAAERDERAHVYNQRSLLDKNREAARLHEEEMKQKEAGAARTLEATGIPFPEGLAKRFGIALKPGQKVLPSQLDEYLRVDAAMTNAGKPQLPHYGVATNWNTGDLTPYSYGSGADGKPIINSGNPLRGAAGSRTRQGQNQGGKAGGKGPKPTFTQTVEVLTEQVLEDSAKGGGTTIDEAIKNVDAYYKDDPNFTPATRQMVKSRLRKKRDENATNPFSTKLATPTAGTVRGGYRFKGGDPAQQSNWEQVK